MASKPRKTTVDVANDLAKHEIQCAERWKTAFNRFDSLEESVHQINDTLKNFIVGMVGFLATALISLVVTVVSIL
jgi:tetrahydromethanopterin S-methyltransferase subunit B|tara:strand:- start:3076 stop:3300 length:225 start_codon:yes stop_codon:yes gene_type:complete